MSEEEKFAISESKEYLKEKSTAISKTRDRSWQLLAFIIAIDVYFIKALLEDAMSIEHIVLTIASAIATVAIVFLLRDSLHPTNTVLNGGHPDQLRPLANSQNDDIRFDVVMNTYKVAIETNHQVLERLVNGYRHSLNVLYGLIVVAFFLLFLLVYVKP